MRVIIQRVLNASVDIEGKTYSSINKGLLVLVGIEDADDGGDIEWLANKIVNMRIFGDNEGLMNLSIKDVDGDILLVSQFTLHASTKKGNRPSFIRAARPEKATPLYDQFILSLGADLGKPIKTGQFGAEMRISLTNDGPVTLFMDSRRKE